MEPALDASHQSDPTPAAAAASARPTWRRILRAALVLGLVALAIMAFASWYFTNTFDFMFGPPR